MWNIRGVEGTSHLFVKEVDQNLVLLYENPFTTQLWPSDTIAVSLSNISEDYYRFMKLRIDNQLASWNFPGNPVNYPRSVQDGKGFFNLYILDVRFFVLEE